jgi:cytochrome c biogenesis protein CcmG/thiol:disulfide interchange protein DsbE
MIRFFAVLPVVIAVSLGGFMLWGLTGDRDPSEIPSALMGQSVPDFDLAGIEGMDVKGLSRNDIISAGRPVVVNIFASWCTPCRQEHPLLETVAIIPGITLVGINYKNEAIPARRWLGEMGNPYAMIGADLDGRVSLDWGVTGVPETFVVNSAGAISYRHTGSLAEPGAFDALKSAIEAARQS